MPADRNSSGQPRMSQPSSSSTREGDADADQAEFAAFRMDRGPVPLGFTATSVIEQFSGHRVHLGNRRAGPKAK